MTVGGGWDGGAVIEAGAVMVSVGEAGGGRAVAVEGGGRAVALGCGEAVRQAGRARQSAAIKRSFGFIAQPAARMVMRNT